MTRPVDEQQRQPSGSGDGLVIAGLFASYGNSTAVSGVNLEIRRSEFVTLLGPSGCGKTTTLRCVAGLHAPRSGEITLGGRRLNARDVNVPPHKRNINMVFQSYAVWPHMTALGNVMYGLKAKKLSRAEARAKAERILDLVGLGEFAGRNATELSGGQQQRIALARALATEPSLVLMDEPLSNLDARLRARMRDEIRQIQRRTGVTVLYVTHDQSEALSMSDRVVVMNHGVIQQIGDPWTLYHRPANRFVATFVGDANVVAAVVEEVAGDTFTVSVPAFAGAIFDIARDAAYGSPARGETIAIVFRPEWAAVSREHSAGAAGRDEFRAGDGLRAGDGFRAGDEFRAGGGFRAGDELRDNETPARVDFRGNEFRRNEFKARLVTSEFLGDHFERTYQVGGHRVRVQAVTGPTSRPPEIGAEHTIAVRPENLTWFRDEEVELPGDGGDDAGGRAGGSAGDGGRAGGSAGGARDGEDTPDVSTVPVVG